MGRSFDVAVFIGSLRREAYSRKLANALIGLAPAGLSPSIVEIGGLPLYNQDDEERPSEAWVDFRGRVSAADAVLFVTPEYNRSVPAALKNALDVASRPHGRSAWDGKPGAVASVSPGPIGAFGANHHLRQTLVYLNVPAMQQPEAYIGGAAELFDANGAVVREKTLDLLRNFMKAYAEWVAVRAGSRER